MWRAERGVGKILRELRQAHGFDLGVPRSRSSAGNHCLDSLGTSRAASYSSSIDPHATAFGNSIADDLSPSDSVRFNVIIRSFV